MSSRKKQKIAIVGVAFRLPGDLGCESAFWEVLKSGSDVVDRIGSERWATDGLQHAKRAEPGRSISFSAGVLSRLDEFDAGFFGISPREARRMDPQQRLLLELAWEAMENAGVPPSRLAGRDCGVYVGISGLDYGMRTLDDLSGMDAYSMTGNTLSIAANRLSYVFDLRGPSLAVDTACSSSLVALHAACRSLASGDCSAALVGGVNLLLHPYPFVGFTKASMLSAQGRCRAFADGGDGYVRAEGGAVLLLKPLEQAEADGDRIHAVILATGSNADGARKAALTIPSADGQAELLQKVLDRAGIPAAEVDYIEAHGTGTSVGDPVEANAIARVLGQGRSEDRPVPIGSVKSNLGHLEPASGMAGLVKAMLILKHRALPPSVHCETPNPDIDFAALNLEVVRAFRPLPDLKRPLRVGINSFGFGGANAHVLLEEYRSRHARRPRKDLQRPLPLVFSARSAAALRQLARAYADTLRDSADPYRIAHAAWHRRERLEHGAALADVTSPEAIARIEDFAGGKNPAQLVVETRLPEPARLAFIYSGNGSQWLGMGRGLMEASPEFSATLAEIDALIRVQAGLSVIETLQADAGHARLDDTAVAQPAIFAIQVAVTRWLRAQGLDADAAAGHSVGEIAAAWAVGALDLEQAVQVICARSRTQAATRGAGRMAAVGASAETVARCLAEMDLQDAVEIAGINSPSSVTLSGPLHALERVRARLEAQGVFYRLLDLDYMFHSRAMDPIRGTLLQALADVQPAAGQGRLFSTVVGDEIAGTQLTAEYWWRNVREPVRFDAAIRRMAEAGYRVFVEIGPHPILQRYMDETLSALGTRARVLSTLNREGDDRARLRETVLRAALLGAPIDAGHYFPHRAEHADLPTYPWQRERHWYDTTSEGYALIQRQPVHPLLGYRLKEHEAAWENHLDPLRLAYLADHVVGGAVVLPAAAYAEMALAASREWYGGTEHDIEELDIVAPVVFDTEHARTLRFLFAPAERRFRIEGRQRLSDDPWTLHATGRLPGVPNPGRPPESRLALDDAADHARIDADTHYRLAHRLGLDYGPAFRKLQALTVRGSTLEAGIAQPVVAAEDAAQHLLHPALLDLCFQSLIGFFREDIAAGRGMSFLPVKLGRLRYYGGQAETFRARLQRLNPRSALVDFELLDGQGGVIARLDGVRFRAAFIQAQRKLPSTWALHAVLRPHAAAQKTTPFPHCRDVAAELRRELSTVPAVGRERYYAEVFPLLEMLPLAFAYDAMKAVERSDPARLQACLDAPDAAPAAVHPLLRWLIDLLQDERLLVRSEAGWQRVEDPSLPPATEIWQAVLGDCPAALPELLRMGRAGRRLSELITGNAQIACMRHDADAARMGELLRDAPTYRGIDRALQRCIESLIRQWPEDRRLRVLEISGGGDKLSALLTASLPAGRFDYVIAEADAEIRARLEAVFQDRDDISVAALDPVRLELAAPVSLPEQFDIVILHHWLHALPQPGVALSVLARRLSPGGSLLLAERRPDRAANLSFGADQTWWRTADDGSVYSSLLAPAAWQRLLLANGWEEAEVLEEPAAQSLQAGCYLVLARTAAAALASETGPAAAVWLFLCETDREERLASRLKGRLESLGQRVCALRLGAAAESCATVLQDLLAVHGRCDHVLDLRGIDDSAIGPDLPASALRRCEALRQLIQALTALDAPPRLWIATAGGASVTDARDTWTAHPVQGAVWGLGRVAMNEHPELGVTLIDLHVPLDDAQLATRLETELMQPDSEREIVLTPQGRFGVRMLPAGPERNRETDRPPQAWRLDFFTPGQLKNLGWHAQEPRAPGAGEVEIRAAAAGLNFRDVMYAMGLLSDEAVENGFAGATLGLEVAGVVSRVGADVTQFAVGDEVVAFAPACFASHVIAPTRTVAKKAPHWSFAEAATIPTVFFTVWYALKHLANLQPGERVLIHGAAGGVGIAAIQVARYLGAEIFATAGNPEKRDFVALMGADHVLDSRSLAFADDILARTQGQGVDVVLNSLAGEAINRNLRVLKPFGRFLELGKRDFYENTHIGLRPFKDNISYFGIDADQLMAVRPELAARLFREVMALFEQGVLRPLPHRVFAADEIVAAFRHMQQSRQIGKIVVTLDEPPQRIDSATQAPALRLDPQGTYLVTGGLAGFGLASARWLARKGAGHLVLLGRRGWQTPELRAAVAELERLGARVHVHACDVSDRERLAEVIAKVRATLPPLRGVLHAAMVIDDGLLRNLDAERFERVLQPKLAGAWNLHELTLDCPVDLFILYSSGTTFVGNPGQANYVAANAGLESLAQLRRTSGLPATLVAWGAIADVGVLTRNETARENLQARLGGVAIESTQALDVLERMLLADRSGLAVMDIDWHAVQKFLPAAQHSRFEWLRRHQQKGSAAEIDADIRALIAGSAPEDAQRIVRELLLIEMAEILRMPAERLDTDRSLYDLGMDSLMAVELMLAIEKRFGVNLPAMAISESPSIERIAERVTAYLAQDGADTDPGDDMQARIAVMVAQHAETADQDAVTVIADEVRLKTASGARLIT